MMYLLDTNVLSEFRKMRSGRAHPNVAAWSASVRVEELHLSVMTIEEVEIGCLLAASHDPVKSRAIRNWIDLQVLPNFKDRILPVDLAVAQQSARLHVPKSHPIRDGLIAATAQVHGLTVVTRNLVDFQIAGLKALNPWLPFPLGKTP